MLNFVKEFGQSVGIIKIPISTNVSSYKADDYQLKTEEAKEIIHLEYLYKLDADESTRLALLESKTSQLIAQTGIIFSLLSLFVPLLIDKVAHVTLLLKILLSILLFLAFVAYLLTIHNALKNFNVNKFRYSRPSAKNVITFQNKSSAEFYNEVIQDLIGGLKVNTEINNKKATNLLHSYNAFNAANMIIGILVTIFCITIFFFKTEEPTVAVKGSVEVKDLKIGLRKIEDAIHRNDTLMHFLKKEQVENKTNQKEDIKHSPSQTGNQ